MSKCDFCDLPAVGYTQNQLNLYCADHEQEALDNEARYQEYLGRLEQIERQRYLQGRCPGCGGAMFWYEPWNRWICESWKEMEGGCGFPTYDDVDLQET